MSFAGRLAVQGDLLFLADIGPYVTDDTEGYKCYPSVPEPGDPSPGDLIILDISNPAEPTLVSHYTPDSLPTDVDDDDPDALPTSFALHQNYPNPFNPTTTIRFDLPRRSEIVLSVYNLLGQEISRQVQIRPAGSHTIELNMGDQSSGVYLYKLQTDDFSETRKMLLLK
ncbi:MAG: T9SS type A sorting domain-containing protein [bacterium]|nr:T9SS type A sorting domain-containing protein [bacterium]